MHPVIRVSAELDLAAELLPECLVLFAVVDQHGMQLVLDLLFQCIVDQLELVVLLQHLAADVQAQILAVHNALDEAEVIGQQVCALFHDEHAGCVQSQTLLILLGVEIIGAMAGHEQQGVVVGGALGAAHDDACGVRIIVELILVEAGVFLVGDLALLLLPDGHHAVQGLKLGVGLPLRLVVLGFGIGFGLLAALFPLHLDGIAHIVTVLFDDGHNAVFIEEVLVIVGIGAVLDVQDDVGTGGFLLSGGQLVAVSTAGLPLPGFVRTVCLGDDGDLVSDHEGGVEAHAELTDDVDVLVLVVLLEVQRTGVGDGAQVLLQLFFGHADAVIGDSQQAIVLIAGEQDAEIALVHAHGRIGQAFIIKFVDGIRSVGDQLTQEDLLVGVDGVDHHVHQLFAFSLKFFLRHNTKPLLYSIQIRPLAKGAAMQKKQPMLHLLSTHIFRVLIYTDAGQKSRGFIKSSEMNWNKMPFVRCYKKFIKK